MAATGQESGGRAGGDSPLGSLRDSAQAVGTVAGTAAGLIAFVYLLGGAVMWLRFHTADLPPDESVAAMSREMLLTVGMRVIVLPAAVAGGLAIALVAASRASDQNGFPEKQLKALRERARARVAKLRKQKPAAPEPARAEVATGAPSRRVKRTWQLGVAIVLALVLVLPFSAGGLVWLTVVFVIIYWGRGFGFTGRPSSEVSKVRLAMVVISVAAIISLGRQFDDPVQLLEARVEFPVAAKQLPIDGVLVSEDSSLVYVGDREDGIIRSIKRSDIAELITGPPIEYAPPASIMSRVVGGGRWSITPVGLWCDGIRYGWLHLGDRCDGSPRPILKPNQQTFFVTQVAGRGDEPGVINIWVRCPEEAPHNCKGYARLSTVKEYGAPALGVLATNRRLPLPPLREDATAFSVEPGRTGAAVIPIRLNDWTTLATKAALGENAPAQLVRMQVTLSADPRGKSVFVRSEHNIRFTQPPAAPPP